MPGISEDAAPGTSGTYADILVTELLERGELDPYDDELIRKTRDRLDREKPWRE